MLENLVRRIFSIVGVHDLSDDSVLNFIRITGLDKLPPHMIYLASMTLPAVMLIIKRLRNENIDWGDMEIQ